MKPTAFGRAGAATKSRHSRLGTDIAKFETGQIVVTPAAVAALAADGKAIDELLARHRAGDWGEVTEQVRVINDRGLAECFNLQSAYTVRSGGRLVVVTNRDRTLTMIHLESGVATDGKVVRHV